MKVAGRTSPSIASHPLQTLPVIPQHENIERKRWRRMASLVPDRTNLIQTASLLIIKLTARDRIDRERQNVACTVVGRSHPVPARLGCKTQANRALAEDGDRCAVEIEGQLTGILDVGQDPGIVGVADPAGSGVIAVAQLIQLVPGAVQGHIFVGVQPAVLGRFADAEDKAFESRDGAVHDVCRVESLDLSLASVFHGVAMPVLKTDAGVGAGTDAGFDTIPIVFFGGHGNLVSGQNAAC